MVIDPAKPFDLEYRVDPAYDGLRLDRYVHSMVPAISRTRIQQYNEEGRLTVRGLRRPDNWKVRTGDLVRLQCRMPEGGEALGSDIPVEVVYEDECLLGVNKQPGLVVHPVALHRHDTLMNALYWRYKDALLPGQELSLVNRIDKYTSGLVLVAKDPVAKRHLQRQFESRRVTKEYLALVHGLVAEEEGEIDRPIGAKPQSENRVLMAVREDGTGRPSQTRFRVEERLTLPERASPDEALRRFTLVRLWPRTGRQHQLRVHLASLGHPLVGDHLYGDARGLLCRGPAGEECRLARFALHAARLTVVHPVTREPLVVAAPLAEDFRAILAGLRADWSLETFPLAQKPGKAPQRPSRAISSAPETA
ncbi:MAG: RluA family pseudouridine synthase [Planctomycetota bacterium]